MDAQDVTVDVQPEVPRLLHSLEEYSPTVPDELTLHYLRRAGHNCEDMRLVRMLSVATQRFAATVVNDALQLAKRRRKLGEKKKRELGYAVRDRKVLLNCEDLAEALKEYGVNLAQPMYYASEADADTPAPAPAAAT